jgi:hypothetical protein
VYYGIVARTLHLGDRIDAGTADLVDTAPAAARHSAFAFLVI